jgi:FAD/FMN-containing dehydrogenase/Fe-S oxidoreductase
MTVSPLDNTPTRDRAKVERDLRRLLEGDVEFDHISRVLYATDAGLNQVEPLGVVAPRHTADVVRLVTYAAEQNVPLVPRGMGSGLAGGAVGAGVQVDFTRYMNRILEIAPDGKWVRVQPGVVMGYLNRQLREYGRFFAPDPSSENYCSLGGMVGTNSSGARSVAYGATKDHVLSLELVMADGRLFTARALPQDSPELAHLLVGADTASQAFATLLPELRDKREVIAGSLPRVVKNCSGYRVEALYDNSNMVHLQRLFVGAEGTLGLVTEITLNLVALPAQRGIAMVYFPSVFACGEAVPGVLALGPSAVEIMDSRFLAFVRKRNSQIDAILPPHTDTAILVEFEGADESEIAARFAELARHLKGTQAIQMVRPKSAEEAERLWQVRKSAVALVQRIPGPRKPLPFIEDVTVHPSEVPGYVDFLQHLFDRHGLDAVMYGHVGDGNIHTRPLLNPKDPQDLRTLQAVYEAASEYVLGVRGTMSGEHGDGLLRTPYIRRMYGTEIYTLFERVKTAFDPQNILNPGKKIAPQVDTAHVPEHLRYGPGYRTVPQRPLLHFPAGEYEREIEKCHGCGQCKSVVFTTMCPTYKATRREQASPRAKANLLRGIITGTLDPESTYGLAAMKAVTDYCIVCGMCAVECPSNVNIPKLMLEAKAKFKAHHKAAPAELLMGHAELVSRVGQRLAPLSNRLVRQRLARLLGQPLAGIDRRRMMAPFARQSFAEIIETTAHAGRERVPAAPAAPVTSVAPSPAAPHATSAAAQLPSERDRVAYFYDIFANYNDPDIALAAARILEVHGLRVVFPPQRGSGVPEMLNGFFNAARDIAEFNVRALLPLVRDGVALVGTEPTASFAFKVHYPDYLSSQACSTVANAFHDLGEFLFRYREDHPEKAPKAAALRGKYWMQAQTEDAARLEEQGTRQLVAWQPGDTLRVAYHLPCHLKAQQIGAPSLALLAEIPGLELADLNAGCCGMAGTFGMKAHTYDLSMLAGRPLFDRVAQMAPHLVATDCSTCRLQIAQATGLPVVHPIKLLADAYGA